MFFFFISFSVLRRRLQVSGSAESRRKGAEEAGRAGLAVRKAHNAGMRTH